MVVVIRRATHGLDGHVASTDEGTLGPTSPGATRLATQADDRSQLRLRPIGVGSRAPELDIGPWERRRQRCDTAARPAPYNWALKEWQTQYEACKADPTLPKPSEIALRRLLNSIKREQFPWMLEVTKNAPQPEILRTQVVAALAVASLRAIIPSHTRSISLRR
jgi:hypothetical protein